MDFGDHNLGVRSIVLQLGNDGVGLGGSGVGFGNSGMDFRNSDMSNYCQFGLGIPSQQSPYEDDGTHVEDMKDPVEVQLPGGNFFLVVLCVEVSRNHAPFTLVGDLPLDLRNSPEIGLRLSPMGCSKCTALVYKLTSSAA